MKKKRFLQKTLILLLILSAIVGIERFSHFLTDGFGIANIKSDLPFRKSWSTTISEEDSLESQKALSQNFNYLASGSQSYVFISDDEKYVIKFFKHKRWRMNPIFAFMPLPSALEKKRQRWKEKKWETVNDTFKSCKVSYELFKKETGVLYVHLNETQNLQKILTVKDKVGLKHKLNLDTLQFALQRKAIPTDVYLLKLKEEGKVDVAEKAVSDMLKFTRKRSELGFSDKDPHLIRNFGFINGQALEIVIGGFHRDPKKDLNYYRSYEIVKIGNKLLPWIEENFPEIAPFTEKQIEILSN